MKFFKIFQVCVNTNINVFSNRRVDDIFEKEFLIPKDQILYNEWKVCNLLYFKKMSIA